MTVEYRPWPRDPRYLVGADGSIIGLAGRPLKLTPNSRWGYLQFARRDLATGVEHKYRAHCVVCETFHGERPQGSQAAHRNGIKTDNRADNLRWATQAENEADKILHGTSDRSGLALGRGLRGSDNGAARLDEATVRLLRQARKEGATFDQLAARFHISRSTAHLVTSGKRWAHVT